MNRAWALIGLATLLILSPLASAGPFANALPAPSLASEESPLAAAHDHGPGDHVHGLTDEAFAELYRGDPSKNPVWIPAAGADDYNQRYKCPDAPSNTVGQAAADSSVCPIVVYDTEDLLSQPILTVNNRNPNLMVFNALHGGKGLHPPIDPERPTEPSVQPTTQRSRFNLLHMPHTNFWNDRMGGGGWHDEPYFAPDHLITDTRKVFGEDNAAAMDGWGRQYHASLYSFRSPKDPSPEWAVGVWMHERTNQQPYGYSDALMLRPDNTYNSIDSLQMVVVPAAKKVVVFWRERDIANGNATFVNVFYSNLGDGLNWDSLLPNQRVTGCREITNGVVWDRYVYFGCLPTAEKQDANNSAEYYHMYALDIVAMKNFDLGTTPIASGKALLAPRSPHGHMTLASTGIQNGQPFVRVSYGLRGGNWSKSADYGNSFSQAAAIRSEGGGVSDAWITALAYSPQTGHTHIIYMEKYTFKPDKLDPNQVAQKRTLYKAYGVVRENSGYKGKFDLNFGVPSNCPNVFNPTWAGGSDGVFEDMHDSIVIFNDPVRSQERIIVTYGEYGCVRFGEIVPETPLVGFPLIPPAPPAFPLAVSAANPALESAAAGLVFGLMMLRLLLARKKNAVTAPAGK